ncbi:hypothetical protein [Mucisphaera sp.]|uniref:hypothetical protein n=1 Tax=Mucisphaera sp. TaxID=2913024 RepID=UPI003D09FA5A
MRQIPQEKSALNPESSVHPAWWLSLGAVAITAWVIWSGSGHRPMPATAQAVTNPAEQRLELIEEVRALREAVLRLEQRLDKGITVRHAEERSNARRNHAPPQ